jgi:hypothetical protein
MTVAHTQASYAHKVVHQRRTVDGVALPSSLAAIEAPSLRANSETCQRCPYLLPRPTVLKYFAFTLVSNSSLSPPACTWTRPPRRLACRGQRYRVTHAPRMSALSLVLPERLAWKTGECAQRNAARRKGVRISIQEWGYVCLGLGAG